MPKSLSSGDDALQNKPEHQVAGAFDRIADDLQRLRASAGHPSYAQIVIRIGRLRAARGLVDDRPARTTVYDCFRTGRTRVNPTLVGEIVMALTDDAEQAASWVQRCIDARSAVEWSRPVPTPDPPAEPVAPEPVAPPPVAPEPSAQAARALGPEALTTRGRAAFALTCLALNLVGVVVSGALTLPLFLDMTGTALAAIVLGPWTGIAVGVATNVTATGVLGPATLPFALVQAVGALCWAYGVRRGRMGHSLGRMLLLSVVTALACTLVATPIVLTTLGGDLSDPSRPVGARLQTITGAYALSVLGSNLFYSLLDKLVAGFLTFAAVTSSPRLSATCAPHVLPAPAPAVTPTGPAPG